MAADLTQTFVGKHFEKIVLAAAGAIFLAALGWFVIRPHSEEALRKDVKHRVDDVTTRIGKATLEDALTKEERVALGIGQPALTVPGFESMLKDLGTPWPALTKVEEGPPPEKGPTVVVEEPMRLPKVVAIEDLQTAVGRGCTVEVVPKPLAKLEAKTAIYDVAWVGVVGKFDLTAELENYMAGNAPYQPIILSKVELRRRELKPDGTWSDWAPVAPAAPKAALAKWPKDPANPQDLKGVSEWASTLRAIQVDVRRMPFFALLASDPEGQTAQSLAGPITGVEQPPPPGLKPEAGPAPAAPPPGTPPPGPPPPKTGDSELPPWLLQPTPTPGKMTEPATKPVTPVGARRVLATLWANDATVEPGKTYQYQMRPSIVNPVYSQRRVADAKARWIPELVGEWSEPTKDVTIPPVAQFFFVGTFAGRPNLELHRWIYGQWIIVPSAQASIGAPVIYIKARTKIRVPGGAETRDVDVDLSPGVLLVDIIRNFPFRPEGNPRAVPTNVLVYAEGQGRLSRRIEWDDRNAARNARPAREKAVPVKPVEVAPPPPKPAPKPSPPRK
jgi:hypothetical protein